MNTCSMATSWAKDPKNLALAPPSCMPVPNKVPNSNQPRQKSLAPPRHVMSFHRLRRLSNDKDSVMISGSSSSAGCEGPGTSSSLAGCTELVLYFLFCKGAIAAGCGCPCGLAGTWMVVMSVCSTAALSTSGHPMAIFWISTSAALFPLTAGGSAGQCPPPLWQVLGQLDKVTSPCL